MQELIKFEFNGSKVRSVVIDGNPYFIAADVCDILGISNGRDAVSRLDEDEKLMSVIPTGGQNRTVTLINESGLYSLVLTSRKPEAKPFKKWVTKEVLPSIRKTGSYSYKQPAINVSRVEVLANTNTEIQKANSRNIAAKLFTENRGEIKPIMDFHRANCEQVTGLLPNQVKKRYNVKSGSALEVLRKQAPHLAATCSLNSYLFFERGASLSQLKELDRHFNAAFGEFAKIGIHLTD